MSYNKETFLATLNEAVQTLRISKKSVTISHGGASLLLGLRDETNDIDVQLQPNVFDILARKHEVVPLDALGWNGPQQTIEFQGVDFHRYHVGSFLYPFSWKEMVDGYDVTPALQLLVDRIKTGRTKDLDDILRLRNIWINLPDHYKDRLSGLLDAMGVTNAYT